MHLGACARKKSAHGKQYATTINLSHKIKLKNRVTRTLFLFGERLGLELGDIHDWPLHARVILELLHQRPNEWLHGLALSIDGRPHLGHCERTRATFAAKRSV